MITKTANASNLEEYSMGRLMQSIPEDKIEDMLKDFTRIQHIYNSAIKEVSTKLEILDAEFRFRHDHNPIHHIESRLKKPKSILKKLVRLGANIESGSAEKTLTDIAGIRVICCYVEDIYKVEELLVQQDDITLLRRSDYIEHPKSNGYRSLHLILSVPIFLLNEKQNVAVEVQIRTIAMDFWASLEHKLKYKSDSNVKGELQGNLKDCADSIAAIDLRMQDIFKEIHNQT